MRWFPFLSRVAFIANLFFLASLLLQWKPVVANQTLVSTILITGLFLAPFIFNPLVNLFYLVLLVRKKDTLSFVPAWLRVANFIFLLVQAFFVLFFLHDPFHS